MNFLYKRSILSRPKLFQEGGGNIFLGEAKPYDINVPISGPSANPAISNKSVEINTTGLSDTINKQKDLSYKWAELQFKYKELGYKEGRDYLEALTDYYDNIGVTREMLNSVGGLGSIGLNQEKSSSFISQQADLQAKAAQALGRRDLNGYANAIAELGKVATQNSDLMYQSKLADKLMDEAAKGSMGYNTPRFMDTFFSHVNNARKPDGKPVQFQDVLDTGLYAIGVNVKSKDIADLIDGFYKTYATEPKKTDTGFEVLPSGVKKVESGYLLPSLENMVADFKSRLFADERGKSYLFGQGLNPDNPNSKEVNDFILGMVQPTFNRMQELYGTTVEYSGEVKKDIKVEGTGEEASIISINPATGRPVDTEGDGSGKTKLSDKDKAVLAYEEEYADIYGEGFVNEPGVISIFRTGKNREEIKKEVELWAKNNGYKNLNPSAAEGGNFVPGTADLPNTLAGIKDFLKLNIDPNTTKEFVKDGTRYLVTIDDNVEAKLRKYQRVLGPEDFLFDSDVQKIVGATNNAEDPNGWDTGILDGRTRVYNLGPATETTEQLSTAAQLIEGDENFVNLNSQDEIGSQLPRVKDYKNPINQGLARLSLPVLNQYGLWVTDTSDSKIHKSAAQVRYKTGFDVNFKNEAGRGNKVLPLPETRPQIAKAILDFRKQGLTAIYEVSTKENKNALLEESKQKGWGLTSDMIQVVPYITGNHFSVACPMCVKYTDVYPEGEERGGEAESSAAESTTIQTAVKPRTAEQILEDRLKAGEKIDISN